MEHEVIKKIVNGKVAVLISRGFGAGWSSWAGYEFEQFSLFDEGLVDLALKEATEEEVKEYIRNIYGDDNYFYTGGWDGITVVWVDRGTKFRIDEYDGREILEELGKMDYVVA